MAAKRKKPAEVIRELQTQLTCIAQFQAQLDHLTLGQQRPSALRDTTRTRQLMRQPSSLLSPLPFRLCRNRKKPT